jgi:PPOX class probable F420-dependent enzyme
MLRPIREERPQLPPTARGVQATILPMIGRSPLTGRRWRRAASAGGFHGYGRSVGRDLGHDAAGPLHSPGWDSELVSPHIATNTVVTREELLDFVRPRHCAIIITARSDGRPQASPVTCGVDNAGRIVVATYPSRAKTRNARRDPRVSVVVLSDDFGGPWVQIDGDAEVIDVPEAVEPLVSYYRAIAGEHTDWAEYRAAMLRQGKSLLRVTPRRWSPVATGGFPPELA